MRLKASDWIMRDIKYLNGNIYREGTIVINPTALNNNMAAKYRKQSSLEIQ